MAKTETVRFEKLGVLHNGMVGWVDRIIAKLEARPYVRPEPPALRRCTCRSGSPTCPSCEAAKIDEAGGYR